MFSGELSSVKKNTFNDAVREVRFIKVLATNRPYPGQHAFYSSIIALQWSFMGYGSCLLLVFFLAFKEPMEWTAYGEQGPGW